MNQSSFPITLPSVHHTTKCITSTRPFFTDQNNFEYVEVRDDADVEIEEAKHALFPRTSSLSFPIEHYCVMVEKVGYERLRHLVAYFGINVVCIILRLLV